MFEIFNNLLENFILTYSIASYLKMRKNKAVFLVLSIILASAASTILTSLNIIGATQTLVIQGIIWLCLYYLDENFTSQDIIVSLFFNILLFISVYLANAILAVGFGKAPIEILMSSDSYYITVGLSKITFALLSVLFIKKKLLILNHTSNKYLNYLLIFELLLAVIMAYYFVSAVLSSDFKLSSNIIFIGFILLFVSFCYIFNILVHMNEEIYKHNLKEQQEYYEKENYRNLTHIKYEIERIEHRMSYALRAIENDIKTNRVDSAIEKIQVFKNDLNGISPIFKTGNTYFDYVMNLETGLLCKRPDKSIKISSFISVNPFYNQIPVTSKIIQLMNIVYDNTDYLELFLSEKNGPILEVKIIVPTKDREDIIRQVKTLEYDNIKISEQDEILIIRYNEYMGQNDEFDYRLFNQ